MTLLLSHIIILVRSSSQCSSAYICLCWALWSLWFGLWQEHCYTLTFFFFFVILLCSGSLSYCIIQSVPSRATGLTFDSRILWHARFQGSLNGRCCCCKTSPIISPPSLCLTACMCWMWHFALWPHISTLVETSVAKQSVFVQSFFKCIVMNVHRNMLTEPCTCSSGVFQFLWELHGMIFESEFSGAATPWKIVGLC